MVYEWTGFTKLLVCFINRKSTWIFCGCFTTGRLEITSWHTESFRLPSIYAPNPLYGSNLSHTISISDANYCEGLPSDEYPLREPADHSDAKEQYQVSGFRASTEERLMNSIPASVLRLSRMIFYLGSTSVFCMYQYEAWPKLASFCLCKRTLVESEGKTDEPNQTLIFRFFDSKQFLHLITRAQDIL